MNKIKINFVGYEPYMKEHNFVLEILQKYYEVEIFRNTRYSFLFSFLMLITKNMTVSRYMLVVNPAFQILMNVIMLFPVPKLNVVRDTVIIHSILWIGPKTILCS